LTTVQNAGGTVALYQSNPQK